MGYYRLCIRQFEFLADADDLETDIVRVALTEYCLRNHWPQPTMMTKAGRIIISPCLATIS